MMARQMIGVLLGAALAGPALASEPAPTTGLKMTPSIDCRPGFTSESVVLSTSAGDPIDATFVFCRDPSKSRESWIRNLEKTRDRMARLGETDAAKAAIRDAFDGHIARERAAN